MKADAYQSQRFSKESHEGFRLLAAGILHFFLLGGFFMSSQNIRRLTISAMCAALGVLLPIAFHGGQDAGRIFLPMHLPILLCGLLCGPFYGLACGLIVPLISHLTTGMPPAAMLPVMLCELAVYGLVTGLAGKIRIKNAFLQTLVPLVSAMLAGRAVMGILNALVFQAGKYSLQIWLTGAFVKALPGIAIQLVLLPLLVTALRRAKVTEKFKK